MNAAAELAGFLAAHAIWCVSDGDTLYPMLAHKTEDGEKHIDRLMVENIAVGVEIGKRRLVTNEMQGVDAVLVYDGFVPNDGQRQDAIILELRHYASPASKAIISLPYTPVPQGPFRVHQPRLLLWEKCDAFDLDETVASFFSGVSSHEKGFEVWQSRKGDAE